MPSNKNYSDINFTQLEHWIIGIIVDFESRKSTRPQLIVSQKFAKFTTTKNTEHGELPLNSEFTE